VKARNDDSSLLDFDCRHCGLLLYLFDRPSSQAVRLWLFAHTDCACTPVPIFPSFASFLTEPPQDLLGLMARRMFSQRGVLSRVNSDGLFSTLDLGGAASSAKTMSSIRASSSAKTMSSIADGCTHPELPRIRTRLQRRASMKGAPVLLLSECATA
jgi:hypothetical protein